MPIIKIWANFIIGKYNLESNTIHTHKNKLTTKVKEDLGKQEFMLLKIRVNLKGNLQCLLKSEKNANAGAPGWLNP